MGSLLFVYLDTRCNRHGPLGSLQPQQLHREHYKRRIEMAVAMKIGENLWSIAINGMQSGTVSYHGGLYWARGNHFPTLAYAAISLSR